MNVYGVKQDGGHTILLLAKRLTEIFSLYLLPPSLTLDIHVMVNMSKQDIR